MSGDTPSPATPKVQLHDDVEIPQLGFGTFQLPHEDVQPTVEEALQIGYRHLDTAQAYGNESEVGAAIAASGLRREEIFVTTKLWNASQGRDATLAATERSLAALGLEQVDLYLIHWPLPFEDLYMETWRAFEELKADGATRSIGVSNFRVEELERLLTEAEQQPTVNQIELHPYLQQPQLHVWHAEHGIATEAWSPIAQGAALDDETIGTIAAHHLRTAAQTILRWQVQLGNVVIPKSATPERIQENFEIFDFELSEDDMAAIARLDRGQRTGPDPATFNPR